MLRTALTDLFGISVPIVQAPMGGGPTTPELVVAVSEAGGLGSLAGGYLTADALHSDLHAVRDATERPFSVNLFTAATATADPRAVAQAQDALEPLRLSVGLAPRSAPATPAATLDDQVDILAAAPPVLVSFTFGIPPAPVIERLHGAGCLLMGTATSVAEAAAIEAAGLDLVCAQGSEAGAHRGTFLGDAHAALVGTIALVPQICDAVRLPVLAAGGIMDGRGLAAALALGAAGAQVGTAFLRCSEAGTTAPHRRALAAASDTATALSDKITGQLARGIRNPLMDALEPVTVPPYPVMNSLTTELRRRAAELDRPDLMALWSGQGAALGTELPAGDLTHRINHQAETILSQLFPQPQADSEDAR